MALSVGRVLILAWITVPTIATVGELSPLAAREESGEEIRTTHRGPTRPYLTWLIRFLPALLGWLLVANVGPVASAGSVLPAFSSSVSSVSSSDVPFTWHPGCPVSPGSLAKLAVTYFGFDGRSHEGVIILNKSVVPEVITVFQTLYQARFPIRRMTPEDHFHGSDSASMAADNTSGFNCRYAVSTASTRSWSAHAYGEAIDVNPVENPYLEAGKVEPLAGSAFVNRSAHHRGMAFPGGALVKAFAAIGWQWGGRWGASPDYQHFSSNGK